MNSKFYLLGTVFFFALGCYISQASFFQWMGIVVCCLAGHACTVAAMKKESE